MKISTLLLALAFAATSVAASPPDALREELDATLLRLADSGQLPGPGAEPLSISQPPRTHHEVGAVLDIGGAGERGAVVLAITPGGAAERLGLRVGDRVLGMNGVVLDQYSGAALRKSLVESSGALVLQVARGGDQFELRGEADRVTLPGYQLLLAGVAADSDSTCGRISLFDVYPRGRNIHPVVLVAIDGRRPGSGPTFHVSLWERPWSRAVQEARDQGRSHKVAPGTLHSLPRRAAIRPPHRGGLKISGATRSAFPAQLCG